VSNSGTHAISPVTSAFSLAGNLAGGVAEASAFISDAPEQCFLVIGTSSGSDVFWNPPMLPLLTIGSHDRSSAAGLGSVSSLAFRGQEVKSYRVQLLMWNPEDFPGNPKQSPNGMAVTHEVVHGPNGGQFLSSPS
jgi:hypothetical protein